MSADVAGVQVQFISRDDLIANKRLVGRPQDRRDVRALERAAEAEGRGGAGIQRKAAKTPARRKK